MSTRTLVTKASTTLTALQLPSASILAGHYNPADVATFNAAILNDINPVLHVYGALQPKVLQIPNRGVLQVLPGDVVAYDLAGWPILVSARSIALGTAWTLT